MVNFYGNAMHFMCVWCCTWEGERCDMHGRGREGERVEIRAAKQGECRIERGIIEQQGG